MNKCYCRVKKSVDSFIFFPSNGKLKMIGRAGKRREWKKTSQDVISTLEGKKGREMMGEGGRRGEVFQPVEWLGGLRGKERERESHSLICTHEMVSSND